MNMRGYRGQNMNAEKIATLGAALKELISGTINKTEKTERNEFYAALSI
jgi:hypothetical protein